MSGENIVERLRTRRRESGTVGALFLISQEADLLLDYIESLHEQKESKLTKTGCQPSEG